MAIKTIDAPYDNSRDLGPDSRPFVFHIIHLRGPITLAKLEKFIEELPYLIIDIGRGATVADYVTVMISEGYLRTNIRGDLTLTDSGEKLLTKVVNNPNYNRDVLVRLLLNLPLSYA